jgi:hypothetical protein
MTRPATRFSPVLISIGLLIAAISAAAAQTAAPAAPAAASMPVPAARLTITPPGGPSEQSVRIEGMGLPANAQAVLMGGQDLAALQQISAVTIDTSGALKTMAEIPGGAEYDRDFHFVLAINGQPAAAGVYRVGSRTAPAN